MKQAYELRIELLDFKPKNYRVIWVDPNITFKILHNYIHNYIDLQILIYGILK